MSKFMNVQRNIRAIAICTFTLAFTAIASAQSNRLYVNVNASNCASADGSSWSNAFCDLNEALTEAADPQSDVDQIWVAQGTYHPADPQEPDAIDQSFVLPHDVRVLGGFDGTEQSADERDPATNVTTPLG